MLAWHALRKLGAERGVVKRLAINDHLCITEPMVLVDESRGKYRRLLVHASTFALPKCTPPRNLH